MKKLFFALLLLVGFTALAIGQDRAPGHTDLTQGQGSRAGEFDCLPGSVYGQPQSAATAGGYFCDANDVYQYTEVIEDYPDLSGSFSTVTIWIGFFDRDSWADCSPGTPLTDTYQITIYNNDNVDPTFPGTVNQSFTLSPTSFQYAGNNGFAVYRVEFTLPSAIGPESAWLGVGRLTRGDGCIIFWDTSDVSYSNSAVQRYEGSLSSINVECAFCLGGGAPTPISGWSLILAGVLIAAAVSFRYIKFRS